MNTPSAEEVVLPQHEGIIADLIVRIEALSSERVALGHVTAAVGERAVATAALMFALPNCVPAPPGIGSALGLPIVALGFALMLGRSVWLPGFVLGWTVRRRILLDVLDAAGRRLAAIERRLKPRLAHVVSRTAKRGIGALVVLLGLTISMPVPLTNFLPAIGTAVISLGLLSRDGFVVLLGIAIGIVGLVVAGLAVGGLVVAPLAWLSSL